MNIGRHKEIQVCQSDHTYTQYTLTLGDCYVLCIHELDSVLLTVLSYFKIKQTNSTSTSITQLRGYCSKLKGKV